MHAECKQKTHTYIKNNNSPEGILPFGAVFLMIEQAMCKCLRKDIRKSAVLKILFANLKNFQ